MLIVQGVPPLGGVKQ